MAKFIKRRGREGDKAERPRPTDGARAGRRDELADEPRRPAPEDSDGGGRSEREPRNGNGNGHRDGNGHEGRPRMSGAKAVVRAKEFLFELTGQEAESVTGLRAEHGRWKVALDVVELERVPRTTDVLASYELELDEEGELIGYKRLGRYYRSQVDQG